MVSSYAILSPSERAWGQFSKKRAHKICLVVVVLSVASQPPDFLIGIFGLLIGSNSTHLRTDETLPYNVQCFLVVRLIAFVQRLSCQCLFWTDVSCGYRWEKKTVSSFLFFV